MVGDLQRGYPGLTLRTTGADQEIPLNCSGLEIVLGHLLGNAAQHGASRVDLNVTGEDGAVVLTVSDDGNGIAAGNRNHIFTPFFTTTREQGGTGMGLTITANLLSAHGASISLLPRDRGAAFAMRFDLGGTAGQG